MLKKMFKKLLKLSAVILGLLIVLAIGFYIVVYFSTQSRINKIYNVPVQSLAIPTDSSAYLRGKHIADNRGCMGCHGANLGGLEVFFPEGSPMGTLVAKNITAGKGGIQYTDKDWIRLLRHGVNPEGKSVWFMPSNEVAHLSNQELVDLICFIKQHVPVDNTVPKKEIKPLGRILVFLNKFPLLPAEIINHNATYVEEMRPAITPEYGAYLATTCQGCHSRTYKGGPPLGPGLPPVPDITYTGQTRKWSEADFLTVMHTGKTPEGRQLSEVMPYKYFSYTEDELKALYAFFHQLK